MAIVLLFFIREHIAIYNFQPLILRYLLFLCYGFVFGLWSTIFIRRFHSIASSANRYFSLDSMCHSRKFSSSSAFAQSLTFRYLGRLIAYSCALHLCQAFLFYINAILLILIFSVLLICYCCRNQ